MSTSSEVISLLVSLALLISCAEDEQDCSECGSGCMEVTAMAYDREEGCRVGSKVVGCVSDDRVCTTALVWYSKTDGTCWEFASGCVPDEWKRDAVIDDSCRDTLLGSELPDCE